MNKPVFIIGCPRSGTTILMDLLCAHERFAWISDLFDHFPKRLLLNLYNQIYDLSLFGKYLFLKKKNFRNILPRPTEPWRFWNTYLSNFQWERGGVISPQRQTEADISLKEISDIHRVIQLICKYQNRDRFLSKYTDFPRIKYLLQAFPDARFIHLLRDGRAVANSYYNIVKKGEFDTWSEREWWIRGWPESWRKSWREKYNSLLGLVAYQWKFFVKEIWEDAKSLPDNQYLDVRYEKITRTPKSAIRNILEFCDLEFTPRIEWYLDNTRLSNMNYKWKQDLDKEQKKELDEIIVEDEFRRTFEN